MVCNECNAVLRRVPAADLQRTFDEMELTLDVASEICPHCGAINLFPGFSAMRAFTCKKCGELVRLSNDPDIGRFFGPADH
jgi:RNase P subunit RPR2